MGGPVLERCKHECRLDSGGLVSCALEEGYPLPHAAENGHKWVTAHWGPESGCAGCNALRLALDNALKLLAELQPP